MLKCFEFAGKGTIIAEERFETFPVQFNLTLAEDADPKLLDQAAEAISGLIIERSATIAGLIGDN